MQGDMSRILPWTYELNYKIEFQAAIHSHRIYRHLNTIYCTEFGVKDTREGAAEYDQNAIGVFKSGDKQTLVGHLPTEVSCLLTYV